MTTKDDRPPPLNADEPPPYAAVALPHAVGLDKRWVAQGQATLVFPADLASVLAHIRGDRVIRALNGNSMFRIHSSTNRLGLPRITLYSCVDQRFLFNIRPQSAHNHQTWYLEDQNETGMVIVRDAPIGPGCSDLEASFSNGVGGVKEWTTLTVKGEYTSRYADILWNNVPVASITRGSETTPSMLNHERTFQARIPANVDIAVIAGIIIAFDSILEAKGRDPGISGPDMIKRIWKREDRLPREREASGKEI